MEETCIICGHLDSEHANGSCNPEGMWPCNKCDCIDILTDGGLTKMGWTRQQYMEMIGVE